MRRLMLGLLTVTMVSLMLVQPVWADIPINERVSLDGNLRFRGYFDDRDFDTDNNDPAFYATMRTMLGFKIQATDDVLFRAKVMDSRYVGVPLVTETSHRVLEDAYVPNRASSSYLELQEGYIFADDVFDTGLDFQIGRFEMEYGRGRIMGSSNWETQGPRRYDGFRVMKHTPGYQLDFFGSILRDYSFGTQFPGYRAPASLSTGVYRFAPAAGYNEMKRYLFGVAGSFFDSRLQPILTIDWDSYDIGFENDPSDPNQTSKEHELWVTAGTYGHYMFEDVGAGRIAFEGDAAVQVGQTNNYANYPGSNNLFAFMVAAEARYEFDREDKAFIGLGFDVTGIGEGDEDPEETYTFHQFYYDQHRFRGYMDYFWNNGNGLMDVYLTTGIMPYDWLKLRANIHNFNYVTSQGRIRPNGQIEDLRLLGQEVDLLAKVRVKESFYLKGCYSLFIPTGEFGARVNRTAFNPAQTNKSELGYYAYLSFITMF